MIFPKKLKVYQSRAGQFDRKFSLGTIGTMIQNKTSKIKGGNKYMRTECEKSSLWKQFLKVQQIFQPAFCLNDVPFKNKRNKVFKNLSSSGGSCKFIKTWY